MHWYQYHAYPTDERSGFDSQSKQSEMTLENIEYNQQKSTDDDQSTLGLKLMDIVIQSSK